jgi:hypothetical protein
MTTIVGVNSYYHYDLTSNNREEEEEYNGEEEDRTLLLFGEDHDDEIIIDKKNTSYINSKLLAISNSGTTWTIDYYLYRLVLDAINTSQPLTILLEAPYHFHSQETSNANRNFLHDNTSYALRVDRLFSRCYNQNFCPYNPYVKIEFVDIRSCDVGNKKRSLDVITQLVYYLEKNSSQMLSILTLILPYLHSFILDVLTSDNYKDTLADIVNNYDENILSRKLPTFLVKNGSHLVRINLSKLPLKTRDEIVTCVMNRCSYLCKKLNKEITRETLDNEVCLYLLKGVGCCIVDAYTITRILNSSSNTIVLMGGYHIDFLSSYLSMSRTCHTHLVDNIVL